MALHQERSLQAPLSPLGENLCAGVCHGHAREARRGSGCALQLAHALLKYVLRMSDFNIRKNLKGIYKRLGVAAQTKAFSFKTRDNKLDRAEDIRTKTCIAILEDYSRNKEKYHNPEQ